MPDRNLPPKLRKSRREKAKRKPRAMKKKEQEVSGFWRAVANNRGNNAATDDFNDY